MNRTVAGSNWWDQIFAGYTWGDWLAILLLILGTPLALYLSWEIYTNRQKLKRERNP